ncbi:HNH endonuclease [Vibrio pectenicida]|uniref:HNH endonuclease n=1 Tax=Vibrio pectenicida TaxID=62763 RepID=A0A427U4Z1_9VIBR|nr:HNH endonuclease signature motif containing protein [Vibrio pectenicida]RSD31749.1 HNH endonuclease [Vibrio pectenicida]
MKIGQLVKSHIKKIFLYCDTVNHDELIKLMDKKYSKNTFGINYPFCTESTLIPKNESKRYWTDLYFVRGKKVRVSSQWVINHTQQFTRYLVTRGITDQEKLEDLMDSHYAPSDNPRISTRLNSRYRGNAIGNAQNLLVRNILSNLGEESFNQDDWEKTKAYFENKCAYCGSEDELVIEHAVPINKVSLGEHRLGNMVPSCKACNSKKADKDFKIFLEGNQHRIGIIEEYMDSRDYVPLGENEQVAKILEMAYQEVAIVSKRYIEILNELFPNK